MKKLINVLFRLIIILSLFIVSGFMTYLATAFPVIVMVACVGTALVISVATSYVKKKNGELEDLRFIFSLLGCFVFFVVALSKFLAG